MYGDAADVYIDVDGDGWMDDINGDGRVDTGDARFLAAAAERRPSGSPPIVRARWGSTWMCSSHRLSARSR